MTHSYRVTLEDGRVYKLHAFNRRQATLKAIDYYNVNVSNVEEIV